MNFVESTKAGDCVFCTGFLLIDLQTKNKEHQKTRLLPGDDDCKILSLDFLVRFGSSQNEH